MEPFRHRPEVHEDPDWEALAVNREVKRIFTSKVWREKLRIAEANRRSERDIGDFQRLTAIVDTMAWMEGLIEKQAAQQQRERQGDLDRERLAPYVRREGVGG